MPQQSLMPESYPPMTALAFEVRSFPRTPDAETVSVLVKVATGATGDLKTRYATTLKGLERDYLDTLVEAATTSYMYEATTRDVVKACAAVKRLARAHAAAHEF